MTNLDYPRPSGDIAVCSCGAIPYITMIPGHVGYAYECIRCGRRGQAKITEERARESWNIDKLPVSASKLVLFCDRQLSALNDLKREIENTKKAAQSLIKV